MKSLAPAGLLITLLTGCQTNAPQVLNQQPGVLVALNQSRAIPQVEAKIFQEVVPVQITENRLVFAGQHTFPNGQVLMGRSTQNEDFLRRVRSSQFDGKQTLVETQPATLFDAYQELDVSASRTRPTERISVQQQRIQFGSLEMLVDLGIQPDFSETRIRLKNKQLFVEMSPRFQLDSKIQNHYRFDAVENLLNPPLKPVGKFSFTAAAFPIWVGPIPLVFKIKPGAALEFAQQAQGALSFATQLEGNIQPSLKLEARLGETPRIQTQLKQNFNAKLSPLQSDFVGQAHARVHLPQINLESKIAGLIGPYIETSSYLDTQWTRTPQNQQIHETIQSQLGLSIYGGLSAGQLFGKDLANQMRVKILDRDLKEIYRQDHLIPAGASNDLPTR